MEARCTHDVCLLLCGSGAQRQALINEAHDNLVLYVEMSEYLCRLTERSLFGTLRIEPDRGNT